MKERYALERELEALGVRSPTQLQREIKHSGQASIREFFMPPIPYPPSHYSTLGFEFDLNFGFEPEIANEMVKNDPSLKPPPDYNFPSEGLQVTDHEERDPRGDPGGPLKDGFVVTLDSIRMEISTAPIGLDDDKNFDALKQNIKKFGKELRDAPKKVRWELREAKGTGSPMTFEHPRTVVNKPNVDSSSTCAGKVKSPGDRKEASYQSASRVPLVITRINGKYHHKKEYLWSSPQATLTLPLARFVTLIEMIHNTINKAPGVAFTGPSWKRLGLRDDLAWSAKEAAKLDRKRRLGTILSDGSKVTDKEFNSNITSVVTMLVMYMLTSTKNDDRRNDDPRDIAEETSAKGSLPLNVKTPLWKIHQFALNDREKFILHELYTNTDKRQNLFKLASKGASVNGSKKLFPVHKHWDAERFLPAAPTWDDLVKALVDEKPVIVTKEPCVQKKGHKKGDEILIAPLTSKIDWEITRPLIAVEMRRIGWAPVFYHSERGWNDLMNGIKNLAKAVNKSWV